MNGMDLPAKLNKLLQDLAILQIRLFTYRVNLSQTEIWLIRLR